MAVVGSLLVKCACLWTKQNALMSRRGFVSLGPRLATVQHAELGLKPLRMVSRNIGSTRATFQSETEAQFPRPGTVAYDRNLANSINLIGSVGVNPNIQYQDSGEIVATSSLSVKKTPQGEPTWFFLEFQSDLAEIAAQHVRKGDRVHVAGRLIVENVSIEPDDEQKQTLVKVVVSNLHFVEDVYGTQAQPLKPSTKRASSGGSAEKRQAAEKAWKLFFDNPNEWYDNRDNKRNPRAPDFKHKATGEGLWIESYYVPSYVVEKIEELENDGVLKRIEKPANASESSSEAMGAYQAF